VIYEDGSSSTCFDICSTGYIYKTIGDSSPQSMYGCFDSFELYRTISSVDPAAALSTAIAGSSPSSAKSSPPSSTSSSATSSSAKPSTHIHPIIIGVVVTVVVLLLAAVAGLTVSIILLKRRQQTQSRPTELQPVLSATNNNVGLKAEWAAKETSITEFSGPVTETKSPWSTTVSPVDQGQEIWNRHGNQPTVMELPANQMAKKGYQELPG
jgi:hypothetical protein